MALDHYVSQVYLRQFIASDLGNRMYAIRKIDGKVFTPNTSSICRIDEGSTNDYLSEPRIIEEFLKGVEPKYNTALQNIEARNLSRETIYVIAGFVAYVLVCSPGGMRVHSGPLKGVMEATAALLDKHGELPTPPPELGGSLSELIESRQIQIKIDPKYPQAMGITLMLELINSFGKFTWEILHNNTPDSPFLTSDFPVAIEETNNPLIINKIIPLSPTIAIRMITNPEHEQAAQDFSFKNFRFRYRTPSRQEVIKLNSLIVRCAETTVLSNSNFDWIPNFVKKHSGFRIENREERIPHGTGYLSWNRTGIYPYQYS